MSAKDNLKRLADGEQQTRRQQQEARILAKLEAWQRGELQIALEGEARIIEILARSQQRAAAKMNTWTL